MPMNPVLDKIRSIQHKPVLALILVYVAFGIATFRDYGFTLDEPLFYGYADAIGYAYSPKEWFSGDFQLERAYGPSPWDHANRGPAYLLLARGPAHLLQVLGLDQASAWHLVNFLAFQFGVYFFYVLCRRWMGPWAAFAATALFSTQPVIWEHAFINPKDPSFMVFFLVALELGFRMADRLANSEGLESRSDLIKTITLPAIVLGLTASIRILGPLAGVLVLLYFLTLKKPAKLRWFGVYTGVAILTMIATWPLLWEAPFTKFAETISFMANNPTELRVLFYGQLYRANELPIRYLPIMFLYTLTEPLWPLAFLGGISMLIHWRNKDLKVKSLAITMLWFAIPFAYVLLKRPPMYDGFRHFMFILPPVFVLAGLAIEALFRKLTGPASRAAAMILLLLPGLIADFQLHPYQYTYYNQFAGGTDKAAFGFETDYWLTCYKDAVESFTPYPGQSNKLFVKREGYIAAYYAGPGIQIIDTSKSTDHAEPGDYVLDNSRANPTIQRYRNRPETIRISRDNAIFCVIEKQSRK
jgi:hypothetical protein